MPQPVKGDGRYMAGLDGLRAIAVLAVMAYHLNLAWAPGGLLGVGVFFVLSGYLITDLLLSQWDRHRRVDLKDFWRRRARRLLPALFVMVLAVVTWVTLTAPALLPDIRGDVFAALLYISNWWFVFHHVSYFARWGPPSPLGHLWSLAVEEQFYLVWPLLLALGLRHLRTRRWLIVSVLVLALVSAVEMAVLFRPGADPSRVYYGTDTRAFALLIGAAAALMWPSRALATRSAPAFIRRLDLVGLAGLGVVGLLILSTTETDPFLYRGGMVLLSVATAALVVALAHPTTRLAAWLGNRPLAWIGVRSYGIYLWHYPVIVLTTPLDAPPNALRALMQATLAVGLAALSWRYLEQPIRRGRLQEWWAALRHEHWRWDRLPDRGRLASAGVVVTLSASLSVAGLAGLVPGSSLNMPTVTAIIPRAHAIPASSTLSTPPFPTGADRRGLHLNPTGLPSAPASPRPLPAGQGVTAIGDSVLIDATPYLRRLLPGIVADGVVGRQMSDAPAVIAWLRRSGDLGHRVFILELGTNGPFSRGLILAVLRDVGPVQHILLVNTRVPRPWQEQVNATLLWAAHTYPHTVVLNWYRASAAHPSWFYPDGVHLDPAGAEAYAALIAHAVRLAEAGPP